VEIHGRVQTGPLGPGGKLVGNYDYHFALNGFIVEGHTTEQTADSTTHFLEIDSYDPTTRSIATNVYADDCSHYSGIITVSDETATWAVKFVVADKQYQLRQAFIVSKDGKTAQEHGEISEDGKTWIPFFIATCTRVEAAGKR